MPLGPMRTKAQKRAGVQQVMHEFKAGTLHSGSKRGPTVTNPKQAVAIALSQTGQTRKAKGGSVCQNEERRCAPAAAPKPFRW